MNTQSDDYYPTNPNYNWDKHELELRNMFIYGHSDGLFFDVGAYHGLWSFYLHQHFKKTVAFDLVQENFIYMTKEVNFEYWSDIDVVHAGVGENPSGWHKVFTHNKFLTEATLSEARHDLLVACDEENKQWRMVRAVTVDDYKRVYFPTDHMQLLKIDVEGYEIEVLKGASLTIMEDNPHLVIEIHRLENTEKITKMFPKIEFQEVFDSGMPHLVHFGEHY